MASEDNVVEAEEDHVSPDLRIDTDRIARIWECEE